MISRWMLAACALALTPAAALAFETVDTIPYPSLGAFPEAYPRDPTFPTNLWAQAGMMYDSNAFRIPDNASPRSLLGKDHKWDVITRLGAGIGHTQRVIGRQGLRLLARGDYYDYATFNQLDHFSYGLVGEWLWEVTNDLSGTVGYRRTVGLGDPSEVQRPIADEVTVNGIYANGAYQLGPNTRLRAGVDQDRVQREGDRPGVNTEATTLRVGADYVTPLANAIGVEVRRSEGSAPLNLVLDPSGQFANNEFEEREVAVVFTYNFGPRLFTSGRVGRTRRTYTELLVDEFDGTTYRARLGWRPEPKLTFLLQVWDEPRAIIEVDATHVVVRGGSFGISWAPTMKLVFAATFMQETRDFQSSLTPGATGTDDTLRRWRLATGWEPRRHFNVGAGVEYGDRSSNTLGRDFDYIAVMANLRYDW